METKEIFILAGTLEKDAEPILSDNKELGCLLTVRKKNRSYRMEVFSSLTPVLYRKALKGTGVIIPAMRKGGRLSARVAYPD